MSGRIDAYDNRQHIYPQKSSIMSKTQPRSILKKSKSEFSSRDTAGGGGSRKAPLFFTGNEMTNVYEKNEDQLDDDEQTKTKTTNDETAANSGEDTDRLDRLPSTALFKAQPKDEVERFKKSSLSEHMLARHPLLAQRKKRAQRCVSSTYILHSKEINAELMNRFTKSIDTFLDEFKRAMYAENYDDAQIVRLFKRELVEKLRSHLLAEDGRGHYRSYSYELGVSLSEPQMPNTKLWTKNQPQRLNGNKKNTKMISSVSNYVVSGPKLINAHLNVNSPDGICCSLPTTSYMDAYMKELTQKDEDEESQASDQIDFNDLKENQDSFIVTQAHFDNTNNNKVRLTSGISTKQSSSLNKCLLTTAATNKKFVRFADTFGFDLENVRLITNTSFIASFSSENLFDIDDEPNNRTNSTNNGSSLSSWSSSTASAFNAASSPFLVLIPLFSIRKQPSSLIKLDSYHFDYENRIIRCVIKVQNIAFQKRVFARITFNNWKTHFDMDAMYMRAAPPDTTNDFDFFDFCIIVPDRPPPSTNLSNDNNNNNTNEPNNNRQHSSSSASSWDDCISRIEFAICCEQNGTSIWDNNAGENYKFQCFLNKT